MAKAKRTARQKSCGLVEVKAILGKGMDGKRIQKSFYGKTKSEARAAAEEYKDKLKRGEAIEKRISVVDWAYKWANVYRKSNSNSASFAFHYESFFNKHLKPYFKDVALTDVAPIDVQLFINKLSVSLAYDTVKRFRGMLFSMFDDAIDNNLLIRNPAKKVTIPVNEDLKGKKSKKVYTIPQAYIVLSFARFHKYGKGVFVMLKTGLRRGELLALKWEDIDLDNDILHVRRAVSDQPGDNDALLLSEGSNETKNHLRDIPIDEETHDIFEWYIPKVGEYVFPNNKGELRSPNNYSQRAYKYFMDDLVKVHPYIPKLNPHELRHTCGTHLHWRGVDVRTIQKVMGHSDMETTSSIYIHDDIEVMRRDMFQTG